MLYALSETPVGPRARVVSRPPTGPTAYAQVNRLMRFGRCPLSAEVQHEQAHAGFTRGRMIVGAKGEGSRLMWVHGPNDW